MAYAEKRGKGPQAWRVKYKLPGGGKPASPASRPKLPRSPGDATRKPGSGRAAGPTRTQERPRSANGSTDGWLSRMSASARRTIAST